MYCQKTMRKSTIKWVEFTALKVQIITSSHIDERLLISNIRESKYLLNQFSTLCINIGYIKKIVTLISNHNNIPAFDGRRRIRLSGYFKQFAHVGDNGY
uniref:Uncharacterized protein n=1 Tax=Romanomermis culicivorax TaxID=13658 RepID=A0A915KRR3_ROMCU